MLRNNFDPVDQNNEGTEALYRGKQDFKNINVERWRNRLSQPQQS
jgi:hypothetical protein